MKTYKITWINNNQLKTKIVEANDIQSAIYAINNNGEFVDIYLIHSIEAVY